MRMSDIMELFFISSRKKVIKLKNSRNFFLRSSHRMLKLKLFVETVEFNPRVLLLTNLLTPVTIDNFPPPQQALWLFNPYSSDIRLRLISHDVKLSFIDDVIIVKRNEHALVKVVFNPRRLGWFDVSGIHLMLPFSFFLFRSDFFFLASAALKLYFSFSDGNRNNIQ